MDDRFLWHVNKYFETRYSQRAQIEVLNWGEIGRLFFRRGWPDAGAYLYFPRRKLLLNPAVSDRADQLIELLKPYTGTSAHERLGRRMLSSQTTYKWLFPFGRGVRISGLRSEDLPDLVFQRNECLRFVYGKRNSMVSFLVDESKLDSFHREIGNRRRVEGRITTPGIIEDGELYYEEGLIDGHNLSGGLGDLAPQVLERSFEELFNLYRTSEINECCGINYATGLKDRIVQHLQASGRNSKPEVDAAQLVGRLHLRVLSKLEQAGASVVHLAETHGDFTPVNILYSKKEDRVYIVDWKEFRRASIYSDFFMFWVNVRHRFNASIPLFPSEWEYDSFPIDICRRLQAITGEVATPYLDAMLLLTVMEKIYYSFVFEKGYPAKWFGYVERNALPSIN